MQGKIHSLAVIIIWQPFHTDRYIVTEDSGAEPMPCGVLANWLLLGHLGEILESSESKIIRGTFHHCHLEQQK